MYKTIIAAYDGSLYSEEAFKTALEMAKVFNGAVHLVSVIHIPDFVQTDNEYDRYEDMVNYGRDYYAKLQEKIEVIADPYQVKVEKAVLSGNPANAIMEYATKVNADLIVVAQRGRSNINKLIFGSVTTNLAKHSNHSILIVKK